jgi:hypothetical protein
MSMIRPLLISLATLLIAPATSHAQDDDVCVAWVHTFIDAEVEGDVLTVTSENTCLMRGSSLDDLPYAEGKPYRIEYPGSSHSTVCAELELEIDAMSRLLAEATKGWPDAVAARDAAATEAGEARAEYERALAAWLAAQLVTADAKAAYEDVYEVAVEIERGSSGQVVIVRQIGYRSDTALGREVLDAIQREKDARRAMDEAHTKWAGDATSTALATQDRVDRFRTVLDLYPSAIEEEKKQAAALGCK